mmetsp:Transcript_46499/g.104522  ORF Transcript_46499/g.104522 Transcript_46499/m.104522 type:complete len:144 (+) Transcript_46499:93-524(+)
MPFHHQTTEHMPPCPPLVLTGNTPLDTRPLLSRCCELGRKAVDADVDEKQPVSPPTFRNVSSESAACAPSCLIHLAGGNGRSAATLVYSSFCTYGLLCAHCRNNICSMWHISCFIGLRLIRSLCLCWRLLAELLNNWMRSLLQ